MNPTLKEPFNINLDSVSWTKLLPELILIPLKLLFKLIPYFLQTIKASPNDNKLIDAKSFKNENEIEKHIDLITLEDQKTNDNSRTLELKNWLEYLGSKN